MSEMPVPARRVFRLGLTLASALAAGYALGLPLPYLAPLFALFLASKPAPPLGAKGLLGLILLVIATLGMGLLLTPFLLHFTASGLLIVALGLYFSNYLTVNQGKGLVGMFLTVGFTLISAAGVASEQLAMVVIQGLVIGLTIAVVCHWLVYPWFPESSVETQQSEPAPTGAAVSNWIALRATLIVLPAYLLALANPQQYMSIIMKAVSLGQQGSVVDAHHAGRELLGSTFLAGCLAVLFWFGLKLHPSLWMFFLWMLLFGLYFSAKLYGVSASRFAPSFWLNTAATLLILLGPAVQDSANGKDVYVAFAVRMGLFIAVTLYAWLAIHTLERLRERRIESTAPTPPQREPT